MCKAIYTWKYKCIHTHITYKTHKIEEVYNKWYAWYETRLFNDTEWFYLICDLMLMLRRGRYYDAVNVMKYNANFT